MSVIYGKKNESIENIYLQLTRNETLLKFLYYDTTDVDVLSASDLTMTQRKKVWNENIFKKTKLPADLSPTVKCYVSIAYGDKRYHHERNAFFNSNVAIIRVLCHESTRHGINGDRCNSIEECIYNTFEGGKIGTMYESAMDYSTPIAKDEYSGFEIWVKFNDFNGESNAQR